jgi:hypothetical protein
MALAPTQSRSTALVGQLLLPLFISLPFSSSPFFFFTDAKMKVDGRYNTMARDR